MSPNCKCASAKQPEEPAAELWVPGARARFGEAGVGSVTAVLSGTPAVSSECLSDGNVTSAAPFAPDSAAVGSFVPQTQECGTKTPRGAAPAAAAAALGGPSVREEVRTSTSWP